MATPSYRITLQNAGRHLAALNDAHGEYLARQPFGLEERPLPATNVPPTLAVVQSVQVAWNGVEQVETRQRFDQGNAQLIVARVREEVPETFSPMLADVVHNLRVVLDQLMYAGMLKCVPQSQKTRRWNFPIREDKVTADLDLKTQNQGISNQLRLAVQTLKPYKDGEPLFWHLHELDRVSKHRRILTVGAAVTTVIIGMPLPPLAPPPGVYGPPSPAIIADVPIKPERPVFPLKDGTPVFRGPTNVKATFEVVFGAEETCPGASLLVTLYQMRDLVAKTVEDFEKDGLV